LAYRVLVVEDHERWRRHLCSVLECATQWELVGAAADGLEGLRKVDELKPDLILLDVGLPGLDGIEVAQRIFSRHPSSRVLFVSEHQSSDIVQAALGSGAQCYITKSDVGRELLPAMDAIVHGRWFIGARFGGRRFDTATDMAGAQASRRHEAGLYLDEASLLDDYARFSEAALRAGITLIAVLPESRRDRLHLKLRARGIDVDRAVREGTCLALEVPATLSRFVVDGRLDEAGFWNAASSLIIEAARKAGEKRPCAAVCGDGAATLLREGLGDAAV
jgi:two-component system nitrate/nitrite response regulator NarL